MNAILDEDRLQEFFISPSRGRRDFSEVIDDVIEFVEEDDASRYEIVVGTDSEQFGTPRIGATGGPAEFVSVVTVHRMGKHGRYFWKRMKNIVAYDHHDRMLKEAYFSVELDQKKKEQK